MVCFFRNNANIFGVVQQLDPATMNLINYKFRVNSSVIKIIKFTLIVPIAIHSLRFVIVSVIPCRAAFRIVKVNMIVKPV